MKNVADKIAERFLGEADPELSKEFPLSLPTWPIFEETNEALAKLAEHFRLAIISNVDDDLISKTLRNLDVSFAHVITSQQVRSYKPDNNIFERALQRLDEKPERIVHIAEGLCEAQPVRQLGMNSVWVERSSRSNDGSDATPNAITSCLMAIVDAANSAHDDSTPKRGG